MLAEALALTSVCLRGREEKIAEPRVCGPVSLTESSLPLKSPLPFCPQAIQVSVLKKNPRLASVGMCR